METPKRQVGWERGISESPANGKEALGGMRATQTPARPQPTTATTASDGSGTVAQLLTPTTPPPRLQPIASPAQRGSSGGLSTATPSSDSVSTPRSSHSPAHEPGSAKYLAKLFRLARREADAFSAPPQPNSNDPSPVMSDFLASFNLGPDNPPPVNSGQFASVDELQLHLRGVLEQKTTEKRAEHVAVTLELRNTVQFALTLSESENDALEGRNQIDPSLGGQRSGSMSVDPAGQTTRVVVANEALMNQPENPVLQRTVAKHLIGIVSAVDGSNWVLRDLSRGAQGWTFTYICKDSLQHWTRQTSKLPTKAVIGEYSHREPDPVLMGRPAFDCRGSITIGFNRSSRAVTVKYDHTLLHKSVAQLSEHYPPPVRELGPGAQRQQQQKTPKKSASERKEKRERKKKKDSAEGQGEGQGEGSERSKKRKKKNNGQAQSGGLDGPVMPPDYPGAPPVDGLAQPTSLYASYQTGAEQDTQISHGYPQALMHDGTTANTAQSAQEFPQPGTGFLPFNVSPEEAARRLTFARKMLSDAGVNPDTLSTDQMNIFANQSPDLQKDSVAMLAKYGAERLQIIHPSNKEKPSSEQTSSSTTPSQATQATPSGLMTTKELAPQSQGPETTSSGRTKKPMSKAADNQDVDEATPSKSRRKPGKSRLACSQCKNRRVKVIVLLC